MILNAMPALRQPSSPGDGSSLPVPQRRSSDASSPTSPGGSSARAHAANLPPLVIPHSPHKTPTASIVIESRAAPVLVLPTAPSFSSSSSSGSARMIGFADADRTAPISPATPSVSSSSQSCDSSSISLAELSTLLHSSSPSDLVILDIRSFVMFSRCHLHGAYNINVSRILLRRHRRPGVKAAPVANISGMISTAEGKEAFAQRGGRTVVLVGDRESLADADRPLDFLAELLALEGIAAAVRVVTVPFEDIERALPDLCALPDLPPNTPPVAVSPGLAAQFPLPHGPSGGPTRVLPWLWVGSEQDARNVEWLRAANVQSVLTIARECNISLPVPVRAHLQLDTLDVANDEFVDHIERAVAFLVAAHAVNDVTFVHCHAGISRSPTVVVAYLIVHEGWALEQALAYLQSIRPCVSPNFGWMCVLDDIAKRQSRLEQPPLSARQSSS